MKSNGNPDLREQYFFTGYILLNGSDVGNYAVVI